MKPLVLDLSTLAAALETAPDAMLAVDPDGLIRIINIQATVLLGYDRTALLGQPVEVLLPEASRAKHVGWRENYTKTPWGRPMGSGLGIRARCRDGREVPVDISLSPFSTASGSLILCAIRDVSAARRQETEMREAQAALERRLATTTQALAEATRRLSELERILGQRLPAATDQVRAAVNSMLGLAAVVRGGLEGPLSDGQQQRLAGIEDAGRHVLELVNELRALAGPQ